VEAWEADLIESPESKIGSASQTLTFKLKPFEIKTLLLKTP
jgi:hypothetical protein